MSFPLYADGNGKTDNGVTTIPANPFGARAGQNAANMNLHHIQMRAISRTWCISCASLPCRYMPDDHGGDPMMPINSLTAYRAGVTGAGAATAGDLVCVGPQCCPGAKTLINPGELRFSGDATALYFRAVALCTRKCL